MHLSEQQLELIKNLELYVTSESVGEVNLSVERMISSLMEEFPNFIYDGLAYRAIRGEWAENKSNYSWSLDFEAAVEACESFNHLTGKIWVYQAQIKGFDLDLFARSIQKEKKYNFSPNFLSFALKEKELLCIKHSNLQFVETINNLL